MEEGRRPLNTANSRLRAQQVLLEASKAETECFGGGQSCEGVPTANESRRHSIELRTRRLRQAFAVSRGYQRTGVGMTVGYATPSLRREQSHLHVAVYAPFSSLVSPTSTQGKRKVPKTDTGKTSTGWQRQGRRPWRWSFAQEIRHRQAPKTPLDAATRHVLRLCVCPARIPRCSCSKWDLGYTRVPDIWIEGDFMCIDVFNECIERIGQEHPAFGVELGWRFLYSPIATFSHATRLAFVGLNPSLPGGDEGNEPIPNVEAGNAYRVEHWAGIPGAYHYNPLQVQVQSFFRLLAQTHLLDLDPNDLMDRTLTLNYCPFRSPNWDELPNQHDALQFSDSLWSSVCECIVPSVIVCMTHEPFARLYRILCEEKHFGDETAKEDRKRPIGWGRITYSIARLPQGGAGVTSGEVPASFPIQSLRQAGVRRDAQPHHP